MNLDHRFAIAAAVPAGAVFATTALARGIGGAPLCITHCERERAQADCGTHNAKGANRIEQDVTKTDGTRCLGWIFGLVRASRRSTSNTNIPRFASFKGET